LLQITTKGVLCRRREERVDDEDGEDVGESEDTQTLLVFDGLDDGWETVVAHEGIHRDSKERRKVSATVRKKNTNKNAKSRWMSMKSI
jgi:hypothetical protein